MPCTYYSDAESLAMLRTELDLATRVACEAMVALQDHRRGTETISCESLEWWHAHKERDRKRAEAERTWDEQKKRGYELRQSAASKLTDAERRELGL